MSGFKVASLSAFFMEKRVEKYASSGLKPVISGLILNGILERANVAPGKASALGRRVQGRGMGVARCGFFNRGSI